jgi:hypothetical protein
MSRHQSLSQVYELRIIGLQVRALPGAKQVQEPIDGRLSALNKARRNCLLSDFAVSGDTVSGHVRINPRNLFAWINALSLQSAMSQLPACASVALLVPVASLAGVLDDLKVMAKANNCTYSGTSDRWGKAYYVFFGVGGVPGGPPRSIPIIIEIPADLRDSQEAFNAFQAALVSALDTGNMHDTISKHSKEQKLQNTAPKAAVSPNQGETIDEYLERMRKGQPLSH